MKLAEELTTYTINHAHIDEIKRLIRLSAPRLKSSHCAEAIARGLQFDTSAAMISSLEEEGSICRKPDRVAFEDFLSERKYSLKKLQVSLFTDAVRLAVGGSWHPIATDNSKLDRPRKCMCCADKFFSVGQTNRICVACKLRDGRTLGINHKAEIHQDIIDHVFLRGGDLSAWEYLSVRPGWSDFLSSEELITEVAQLVDHRERAKAGDFTNMPETVKSIFRYSDFFDVMNELKVPFKKAQAWVKSGKTECLGVRV